MTNMLYFVGYEITGKAAEWHQKVTAEISDKFGIEDHDKRIPPHITIFRPFESSDVIQIIESMRTRLSSKKSLGHFVLSGFGKFEQGVVFADVMCSDGVREWVKSFQDYMDTIYVPKNDYPEWRPHATLASKFPPVKLDEIWKYVSTLPNYSFTLPINGLTLFCNEGEGWKRVKFIEVIN